jgi:hypothetical protein
LEPVRPARTAVLGRKMLLVFAPRDLVPDAASCGWAARVKPCNPVAGTGGGLARVGMLGFSEGRRFAGEDGATYEVFGHARGVPIGDAR